MKKHFYTITENQKRPIELNLLVFFIKRFAVNGQPFYLSCSAKNLSTHSVVTDFGRSNGKPIARDQQL